MGKLGAAEPAQDLICGCESVVNHNVVVGTLLVRLHFKLSEEELDPMAGGGGKDPNALFLGRVVVGVVRAGDFARWLCHFVLAATLLTVVAVVVKNEALKKGKN